MRRFTVVGTDTGVGKTWVTDALVRAASNRGVVAIGLKPIESGVADDTKSDTALLATASSRQPNQTNLVQFEPAIAPGLISGNGTEVNELVNFVEEQCSELRTAIRESSAYHAAVCFVETAGGWYSPVSLRGDVRELAVKLASPVIIVGKASLGAINQIRLTASAVREAQLPIAAIVLSQRATDEEGIAAQNQGEIAERTGLPTVRLRVAADANMLISTLRRDPNWGW